MHPAEARDDAAQRAAAEADGSERADGRTAEGAGGEAASRDDTRAAADARLPESSDDETTGPATPVRSRAEASRAHGATGSATPMLDLENDEEVGPATPARAEAPRVGSAHARVSGAVATVAMRGEGLRQKASVQTPLRRPRK